MRIRPKTLGEYENLLVSMASMSRLFSESNKSFLHHKYVERLYCKIHNAKDVANLNMSFDAILGDMAGVGIKTFGVENLGHFSLEKVAEFGKDSSSFSRLTGNRLIHKVAEFRNARVQSDIATYGIDADRSIYHCVVRSEDGEMMIHEEPYTLIDSSSLKLLKTHSGNPHFTDGRNFYSFSRSKNTLYMRFDLSKNTNGIVFKAPIIEQDIIFDNLLQISLQFTSQHKTADQLPSLILPLYSTRTGEIATKSGINGWNAGGRMRNFGEAYIPIPAVVWRNQPQFFPGKDKHFELELPNGRVITASACQGPADLPKALMSYPNKDLLDWLFLLIDGTVENAQSRMSESRPYTFDDLKRIGRDSVIITKMNAAGSRYKIDPASTGSYSRFEAHLKKQ